MSPTTAHTPQADANTLFSTLQGVAHEQLTNAGSIVPCGAYIRTNGQCELHMVADATVADQQGHETALLAHLNRLVSSGQVRAIGWCLDVRTTPPQSSEPTDAVLIVLEHISGEAVNCFIPYHHAAGSLTLGRSFAARTSPRLFKPQADGAA